MIRAAMTSDKGKVRAENQDACLSDLEHGSFRLVPKAEEFVHLAHLGDSRIYRFRVEKLEQLTEDHFVVALLFKNGEVTAEEARRHRATQLVVPPFGMNGDALPEVHIISPEAGTASCYVPTDVQILQRTRG
jgi:serine/threonine protein phosphatase PrpC